VTADQITPYIVLIVAVYAYLALSAFIADRRK
jgi:hypothetical protein